MKYYKVDPVEQEAVILIDYYNSNVSIYVNRSKTIERLIKRIGEPNNIDHVNGLPVSATWNINFNDTRKITLALSRPALIGNMH